MFKKLLTSLMVIMVMVFGVAIVQPQHVLTQVSAYGYDKYLNGDHNYQLIYGHMGVAEYLDISSITVITNKYTKQYTWAQNEVEVNVDKGNAILGTETIWFSWVNDGSDNGAFYYSHTGKDGDWKSFDFYSTAGYMQSTTGGFSAGFYHAFGFSFT